MSISIIMPARNAAATIYESISSVLIDPLVTQLVIVDDGSVDETQSIIAKFTDPRILCIAGQAKGISVAFNDGLAACTGEYVARCDADDLYPQGRFVKQVDFIQRNSDFVAISGGYQTIDGHGNSLATFLAVGKSVEITGSLQHGDPIVNHLGTWLIRTIALRQSGGMRPWFETSEDADLAYRLAKFGRIWHDTTVVYFYRVHAQSITHTQGNGRRQFFNEMAVQFARQRYESGSDQLERGEPPPLPDTNGDQPLRVETQIVEQIVGHSWDIFSRGESLNAFKHLIRGLRATPFSWPIWRSLVVMGIKLTVKQMS